MVDDSAKKPRLGGLQVDGAEPAVIAAPKPIQAKELSIALGHPRRLRILIALLDKGPGSATSLSRAGLSDLTLKDVNYHLKTLHSVGAVALLRSEQIRGTRKHTYGLADPWRELVEQIAAFCPR